MFATGDFLETKFLELGLAQNEMVTKKSIEYFMEVIAKISNCRGGLLQDCAVICAFLQNTKAFDAFYIRCVDPLLRKAYSNTKENPPKDWCALRGGALMRAFYSLMQPHGFTTLYGVVLTGSAEGFGAVLANKVLFKDLTGPMHGEFTHSLQWLSICLLQECACAGVVEGGYKFGDRIGDIYGRVGAFMIKRYVEGEGKQEVSSWPGEIRFKSGMADSPSPKYLWDMMVDTFASINPHTNIPLAIEDPCINLYSCSYRCPANITFSIQSGSLCTTFIAAYWHAKRNKYARVALEELGNKPKWYWPNIYNPMMIEKQAKKRREEQQTHTWTMPGAFIPNKEMREKIKKKPGWAQPDLDSEPDWWDDDPF